MRPFPNNYQVQGVTLKFVIQEAYDLHDFQIGGEPPWADTLKFDIAARTEQPPADVNLGRPARSDDSILQSRLQNLLEDRFHLRVHRATKDRAVLKLIVAGHGSKMRAGTTDSGYSIGPGRLRCSDLSMSGLASILSDNLDVIVIDGTGLLGGYQFSLNWKPQQGATLDDDRPELPTALKEQLGLKLVKSQAPVEMLLVDHVEMPSDN